MNSLASWSCLQQGLRGNVIRIHPNNHVIARTSKFVLRPSARPLSLAGLLVDLLGLCQHLGLQNCHNDWRGCRRRAISSSRPGRHKVSDGLPC
jgi:hypothetical protein